MRIAVIIASDTAGDGRAVLRQGDRAAVHWGVALAGAECRVNVPRGDQTAATYAAAVQAITCDYDVAAPVTADLVLIGPGAIDIWGDESAGRLAESLDAELVFEVQRIDRSEMSWRITCDVGHGARDVLTVASPAVLVVSDQVDRPPYVSSARRMLAARSIVGDDVPPRLPAWQPVTPRCPRGTQSVTLDADDRANAAFGITTASETSGGRKVIAEAPTVCAQVLLRYLVHHGFVDRVLPDAISANVVIREARSAPEREDVGQGINVEVAMGRRRGPRGPWDNDNRRARQPRPAADPSPPSISLTTPALARGPRRSDAGIPGRRGPFRLSLTAPQNAGGSPTASGISQRTKSESSGVRHG